MGAELELMEIVILIMSILAITVFSFSVFKRRDLLKWMPGFICLLIVGIATNAEALVLPDTFNTIEHTFCFLTGAFMCVAAVIDVNKTFYSKKLQQKMNTIKI